MSGSEHDSLVEQQIDYYRARAPEYDEWIERTGRYDRGEASNRRWQREVATVAAALENFSPGGEVLEFAAGTGWWTEQLLRFADRVTAVDASGETLAINRARVGSAPVRYVEHDIFAWEPDARYDVVFFSFWLSHVPPERFEPFWDLVHRSLKPDGRVFLIDTLYFPETTAVNQYLNTPQDTVVRRRLNDGREYDIVKVFYEAESLSTRLAQLGWKAALLETEHILLYGSVERSE